MSGKAQIKIFNINAKGGGTIMIQKRSGVGFQFAKELAFKVIRFLLNEMISGNILMTDIEKFKRKKSYLGLSVKFVRKHL